MAQELAYDRPSEPLGQGRWAASPWMIAAVGGATIVITAVFVVLRIRQRLRARQARDLGPISSRRPSVRPGPR